MANIVRGLFYFVILALVQALILNNIHYMRLITPLLYVYFIIKLPVGYSSIQATLLSFLMGITIDIFANTAGMHAAACTLAGFARPYVIRLFVREDLAENISPSFRSLGYGGFLKFAIMFIAVHHTVLFCIESMTLFNTMFLLVRIVAGIATTTALICIVEAFNKDYTRSGE